MKIFYVNTLGNLDDPALCVLDAVPEGIGVKYSFLVKGREIANAYPEDAKIHMSADREGLKLASLIGNTNRFLIVESAVKKIIEEQSTSKIEYLPVSIINHKNKVHSNDYFIINPVGYVDVIDYDHSDIDYFKDKVLGINRLVFNAEKLGGAPAIFRIKDEPTRYYFNEELVNTIAENGFTNFKFVEVSVK